MLEIKARDADRLVGGRDRRLVEGGVGGMLERSALEALVVVDGAVADELHLGHARDGLEVWRIDFGVASALLPCPYDSEAGSNALWDGDVRQRLSGVRYPRSFMRQVYVPL